MSSNNKFFVLGSRDPEMVAIRGLLTVKGFRYAYAKSDGKRCVASNAYSSDALSKPALPDDQIVWVECRTELFNSDRDLIVDHHNLGDPGFAALAEDFWLGSSIGQVSEIVGGKYSDLRLVAASDHCLSAAMRGECKGICPRELMDWRIRTRASMAGLKPWMLRRRIDRATDLLSSLPKVNFGGELIIDASLAGIPELRDAAAIAKVPVLTMKKTSQGLLKLGLYGGGYSLVSAWLQFFSKSGSASSLYGNPYREYAGVVLNPQVSQLIISQHKSLQF